MNGPKRFRKRPVVIEAMRWEPGDYASVGSMIGWLFFHKVDFNHFGEGSGEKTVLNIVTLEGTMTASPGDWIIRGVQGEFYPCKPEIFEATYEPVGS